MAEDQMKARLAARSYSVHLVGADPTQALAAEKAGWRAWFDHYVFGDDAAAAADHLPMAARGVLGPASDERTERLRNYLLKSLQRR